MTDIFKFWSRVRRGEKVHPADKKVFARINSERHGFRLECLPSNYLGALRSAPVVLLYLSPGFSAEDLRDARSEEGKSYYKRVWAGNEPLPGKGGAGYQWLKSRTGNFGDYALVRHKVATLNIGAYHSVDVRDYSSLLALPSSRASLTWAQDVLFPEAEAGNRIVVCMRSAGYWGLETGKTYGKSLFAPHVTRSGHLIKNTKNQKLIKTIQKAILA